MHVRADHTGIGPMIHASRENHAARISAVIALHSFARKTFNNLIGFQENEPFVGMALRHAPVLERVRAVENYNL